jgi:hypothetical protein
VVRVLVSLQMDAGGVVHVIVVHGSALHALFAQPNAQSVSVGA